MNELMDLWDQWANGVVPPETSLWGVELYWWNRIGIGTQAIALIILFFEFIGSDGRVRIVKFFDSQAYDTMVKRVISELDKAIQRVFVATMSFLLSLPWHLLTAINRIQFRMQPDVSPCPWTGRTILDIESKDEAFSQRMMRHNVDYVRISKSTSISKYQKTIRLLMWFQIAIWTYFLLNPPAQNIEYPLGLDSDTISILIILFAYTWGYSNMQVLDIPIAFFSATFKIIFHICHPLLKHFFDEKYERFWLAAALGGGAFGLHFSILIG